ncbi:MAG: Smr/MutS family protein [Planctomycetota bacterium]
MSPARRDTGAPSVDLHGLRPSDALAKLARAIHAARVRGATEIVAITGRGASNTTGEPVLRTKVERWSEGDEARRLGVRGYERESKGGALRLRHGPAR